MCFTTPTCTHRWWERRQMASHPHPTFSSFPMSKLRHIMVGDVMKGGSSREGGGLGFSMEDAAVGMGHTLATCSKH